MTCAKQTWIGAYVLNALEPAETEDLRKHLSSCPLCQDEVVSLTWIPALLRSVTAEDVAALDDTTLNLPTPLPMLDRLLAATHAARGTRRWRRPAAVLSGLVAAATIAGITAIGNGHHTGTSGRRAVAIQTFDLHRQIDAAVTLNQRTEGTEVRLRLRGVPPGEHCSLVAYARDGHRQVAATWVASYVGTANVSATTIIPTDQLSDLDIVTAAGHRLVRMAVLHPSGAGN
jgi:hypothetical protein